MCKTVRDHRAIMAAAAVFFLMISGIVAIDSESDASDTTVVLDSFDDIQKNSGTLYKIDRETGAIQTRCDFTFVLGADIAGSMVLEGMNDISLDLNGKRMTGTCGKPVLTVSGDTTVRVMDSSAEGRGTLETSSSVAIENMGRIFLESGSFTVTDGSHPSVQNSGRLTVGSEGETGSRLSIVSSGGCAALVNTSDARVYGGSIVSKGPSVENTESGNLRVSGGMFDGTVVSSGSMDVKNGSFSGRTGPAFLLLDGTSFLDGCTVESSVTAVSVTGSGSNTGSEFRTHMGGGISFGKCPTVLTAETADRPEDASVKLAGMELVFPAGTSRGTVVSGTGPDGIVLDKDTVLDCRIGYGGGDADVNVKSGENGMSVRGGTSLTMSGDVLFPEGSFVKCDGSGLVLDHATVSAAGNGSVVLPDIVRILEDVTVSGRISEAVTFWNYGGTHNKLVLDGAEIGADVGVYMETLVPEDSSLRFVGDTADRNHVLKLVLENTVLDVRGTVSADVLGDSPIDNTNGYVKSYTDISGLVSEPEHYVCTGVPGETDTDDDPGIPPMVVVLTLLVALVVLLSIIAVVRSMHR